MALDRTHEEWDHDASDGDEIVAALDRAVDNVASFLLAAEFDLDAEPSEALLDRAYDDLRESLTDQQLLRAVLDLLMPQGRARARQLTNQFRALPEPRRRTFR